MKSPAEAGLSIHASVFANQPASSFLNKDALVITTDVIIDLFTARVFSIELIPDAEVRAGALLNL